ncbi:5-methylcytosine restriction system specificity protein McrC [Psychrobacter sp. CAL346-MNA-CIBAN-0220]|uniref:McrC family protein n=1 Tax=Psychrobacter sp. CAL346-MNA-CIBAN-0220 TaxID=3140457 RepID=UPI0033256F4B
MRASEISIITVFEHQRLTVHDFTQTSDFTWLLTQEFAVFSVKRQRGQWQLKVGHYIGIIILPSGMTLEILPKAIAGAQKNSASQPKEVLQTRQWVQRMLTDLINDRDSKLPNSKNFGQLSHHLAPLSQQMPPLSEWLVAQFLQLLSAYHPSKHYQSYIHNQSTLQGKLLIKEQLRRNQHQPHKFMCEASVLSQNMLCNRLIKSALLLLEPLTGDSQASRMQTVPSAAALTLASWRQIIAFSRYEMRTLESLYVQAKRQLNAQPLMPQQLQSAQQLLDLAYWLLQQSSVNAGSSLSQKSLSDRRIPQLRLCLLINMNQAFEKWASRKIAAMFNQRANSYQPLYQSQQVWLRDSEGQACLSIRPDLLIYKATDDQATANTTRSIYNHVSHVIDIKWKHLEQSSAISASDAYQLASYAQAYRAGEVWLVYPVADTRRQPVALRQHSDSDNSSPTELWLMPFNVLTGTINGLPPLDTTNETETTR